MNNYSNDPNLNQPNQPSQPSQVGHHYATSPLLNSSVDNIPETFESRSLKVLQVAKSMYQRNPDWVTFFREVLGVNGAARNVFRTNQEYIAFEQSPEFNQIQQMVASLRSRKIPGAGNDEPTRVITVRLPESLHEALKAEATDHQVSMNKLCISKLLQVLSECESGKTGSRANSSMSTGRQVMQPSATRNVPPVPRPVNPVPVPAPNRQVYGSQSAMRGPVPAPSSPVPAPMNPSTRDERSGGYEGNF
ncbi:MAG TPA: toxin-antitoxin system HicB family antitoxin [Pirellulaceae bacterium]|nr:toxin-antitoxin system HicB family antitoxin [Pirellulaceae bacterium]HMO91162.1 toxin-antitoxin system HicB family antitoxin [Pirellulaceae bacterium]HMP69068.1 toxin-antitoxin system HicB family antitoxin [Pirellulaceae bacterium]